MYNSLSYFPPSDSISTFQLASRQPSNSSTDPSSAAPLPTPRSPVAQSQPHPQAFPSRPRSLQHPSSPSPAPPPPLQRSHTRSRQRVQSQIQKDPPHASVEPLSNSTTPINVHVTHDAPAPLLAEIVPVSMSTSPPSIIGSKRRHAHITDPSSSVALAPLSNSNSALFLGAPAGAPLDGGLTGSANSVGASVFGGNATLGAGLPNLGTPTSRRRVRNPRGNAVSSFHGSAMMQSGLRMTENNDAMDVEDDSGRERKRVARR